MGHYCWVCDSFRPNEAFSGKGHQQHICKKCAKLPREERERIQIMNNIYGFLRQRNISAKNIAYLKKSSQFPNPDVQRYAQLILRVAQIKPQKRGRIRFLAGKNPKLLAELRESGLLDLMLI